MSFVFNNTFYRYIFATVDIEAKLNKNKNRSAREYPLFSGRPNHRNHPFELKSDDSQHGATFILPFIPWTGYVQFSSVRSSAKPRARDRRRAHAHIYIYTRARARDVRAYAGSVFASTQRRRVSWRGSKRARKRVRRYKFK